MENPMRHIIAGVLLVLALTVRVAPAGELREVELNDGSVITGEVLSLSSGVYTVRSETLGTMRIEETKIRAVRSRRPAPAQAGALTDRMMGDKEIMALIQGLQDDPDFKKMLEDPAMMDAAKNNDYAALMANPEFMKLLGKPAVRSIVEKVK
jgi:hypothetical protein